MTGILIIVAAFVLAVLVLGGLAAVQLARLQAAVMVHRASEGSRDDDAALYRAAGFDGCLPPAEFVRGSRFDVCAACGQPRLAHGTSAFTARTEYGDECPDVLGREPRVPPRRFVHKRRP